MKSIGSLKNEAYSLLLPTHLEIPWHLDHRGTREASDIIKGAAEQAFLETVIFKLGINSALPTVADKDFNPSFSCFPQYIGPRIHYLDLVSTVRGLYNPHSEPPPLNVASCRNTATCMEMLKSHFTNLKACILTLDIRIGPTGYAPMSQATPPCQPFDQSMLLWPTTTDTDTTIIRPTLATEIATLFDAFVTKGSGKSQFVRIRYFPGESQPSQTDGENPYEPFCYGPWSR